MPSAELGVVGRPAIAHRDGCHAIFAAAAEHVRSTRSAGVETHEANSFHMRPGAEATTQLRYRSEMADLFTDLAIDVGLRRHHEEPVAAA